MNPFLATIFERMVMLDTIDPFDLRNKKDFSLLSYSISRIDRGCFQFEKKTNLRGSDSVPPRRAWRSWIRQTINVFVRR